MLPVLKLGITGNNAAHYFFKNFLWKLLSPINWIWKKEKIASDTLRAWSYIVLACENIGVRPVRVRNDFKNLNLNCERENTGVIEKMRERAWVWGCHAKWSAGMNSCCCCPRYRMSFSYFWCICWRPISHRSLSAFFRHPFRLRITNFVILSDQALW